MNGRPLRILYHHRIAASDGMRVHVDEVVSALRQAGHVVEVVGPGGGEAGPAGAAPRLERIADALRRTLPAAAFELLELAYNVPAYLRLRRAARAFRPDVLYERYNLHLLAGLLLRRRYGVPMLLEVNAPLAAERSEFGRLQLKGLARRCETALWRGADAVLPVTAVLAEHVRNRRGHRKGIHVVPNGAVPERKPDRSAVEAVRRRLGLPQDAVVLGFVGFVRAWHGAGWAVDALRSLPANTHLVVVGDGPALPALAQRAQALGVGARVHLVGRAPHADIPAWIGAFDVALQTAATPYASPLKLFEYMCQGRAVVAPDQPNIREVLAHQENALLFPPGDDRAFRSVLARLCRDAVLRRRLGSAARRTVLETPYTWAANAGRIAAVAEAVRRRRAVTAPRRPIASTAVRHG